jgi:hypothetical protein
MGIKIRKSFTFETSTGRLYPSAEEAVIADEHAVKAVAAANLKEADSILERQEQNKTFWKGVDPLKEPDKWVDAKLIVYIRASALEYLAMGVGCQPSRLLLEILQQIRERSRHLDIIEEVKMVIESYYGQNLTYKIQDGAISKALIIQTTWDYRTVEIQGPNMFFFDDHICKPAIEAALDMLRKEKVSHDKDPEKFERVQRIRKTIKENTKKLKSAKKLVSTIQGNPQEIKKVLIKNWEKFAKEHPDRVMVLNIDDLKKAPEPHASPCGEKKQRRLSRKIKPSEIAATQTLNLDADHYVPSEPHVVSDPVPDTMETGPHGRIANMKRMYAALFNGQLSAKNGKKEWEKS